MKNWGLLLIVIGLGSFVLPYFGFQFQLINLFGEGSESTTGLLFAALGAVLFLVGTARERKPSAAVSTAAPPPPKAPDSTIHTASPEQKKTGLRCSACNNENAPGDRFCSSCGADLTSTAPPRTPTCTKCGAALTPGERFCGQCGASIGSTIDQKPTQPKDTRRSSKLGLLAFIVILGVIGAVLWNSGILSRYVGNNPPSNTTSPPTTQPQPPTRPNPQPNPATAVLTRAWTLPNVFGENGQFGLYVYANFSATGVTRGQFVALFLDSAGRPLRTSSGELEVSAPFSLNVGTGGSSVADASVFVPYDQLELPPGDHALQILPSLLDDRGNLLTKGSLMAFPYHQDSSSITRVIVTPDATDSSGNQGILVTADFISEPLSGPQGMVILHFKYPGSGQPLTGQQPYLDSNGNLATWQPYTSAAVRSRYANVQLFLPYSALPTGMQELSATISLYDPIQSRFLTPFIPFQIILP